MEELTKIDECTQQYKGVFAIRKSGIGDEEIWFATLGKQIVSRGTFKTVQECLEDLENFDLETLGKMFAGIVSIVAEKEKEKEYEN